MMRSTAPLRAHALALAIAFASCWALVQPLRAAGDEPPEAESGSPEPESDASSTTGEEDDATPSGIAWQKDLDEALKGAKDAGRPVMVDFGAEWCGFCKKLDRETFGDARVVQLVRDHFIPVRIDVDESPALQREYEVSGLPTVVFLSPSGEEMQRIVGFREAEPFIAEAKKAVSSSKTLETLREAAAADPDDAGAARAYARALAAVGNTGEATGQLEAALERQPDHPGLLLDLAELHVVRKERDAARGVFERLLELPEAEAGETQSEARLPYGKLLVEAGDPGTAVEVLGRWIEEHPPEEGEENEAVWKARFWRGYAWALLDEAPKAMAELRTVRDKDQGSWGIRANYILDLVASE